MRPGARPALAAAALMIGLAIVHTWPLASAPARLSLNSNADAQLNEWIISWVAHALLRHPAALFTGNIFAPEAHSLVYSEPLIVPALAGAPVRWLGGSPVLDFNLLLIAGLSLTAWSTWFVVWRWTGSWSAGAVSGALAAFNVHLLTRLPHLQAAHAWGLPLTLYFADRIVERPTRGGVAGLALTLAATAATSLYWLVFALLIILVVLAGRVRQWRAGAALVGATGLGLLFALPVVWPYARFAAAGATRPLEIVAQFSATPSGYAASTSRLFKSITVRFSTNPVNVLFPGVTATLLALGGFWSAVTRPSADRRRSWTLVAIGIAGVLLSFGPATSLYRALYAVVPPLRGIRAAARFGYLLLLVVAVAAGWGVAALERRGRSRLGAAALTPILLMLITAEAWQGTAAVEPFASLPPIYSIVRDAPGPVLLAEFPFYLPDEVFQNGEYVLNATAHWRPLMNGYSGVTPDFYRRVSESLWLFPAGFAMDTIQHEGVTHVMVHLERFGAEAPEVERALAGRSDVRLIAADPRGHRLYKVIR